MKITACHESILRSRATALVIGLSLDGTILTPVVQRLMGLYPCFYNHYKHKAHQGELVLGDIIVHPVQKQTIGLPVTTNTGASHIIGVIVQSHATQNTKSSAWQKALGRLDNVCYELMRYKGVRHIALLAPKDGSKHVLQVISEQFWQNIQKLSTPRVRLDVHFEKTINITHFTQSI